MSHPETIAQVLVRLEPDASFDGCAHDPQFTPERRAAISTAISLKRIADALTSQAGGEIGLFDAVDVIARRLTEKGS